MKRNTTTMTFAKGTLLIFLAILCIHFLGFLSLTSQISDVDRLQKRVSETRVSLGCSIGDLDALPPTSTDPFTSTINKSPGKKKQPKPPSITNKSENNQEPVEVTEDVKFSNPFLWVKVLEYWAPKEFLLHSSKPKKRVAPINDEGEVKKDSMHLSLFSNILQIALNEKGQERIFEENIDSKDIYLLVQIKDLPFSSELPPERQLYHTVQLNGVDHSIAAVLRANNSESYILIVCKPTHVIDGNNIFQLKIGNPSPKPFIINFNKKVIHHGVGLLKK